MQRNKNFIIVGDQRFGFHPGALYHIARRFALSGYRVAVVSYFISPFHFLGAEDKEELRLRKKLWLAGGEWTKDLGIWSYVPFTLLPIVDMPILKSRWVMDHSDRLTVPSLSAVLKKNGFDEADLLWIDSSRYAFALDRIPHKKSIFRPSEDITLFQNESTSFLAKEKEVLERVDTVISHCRVLIDNYQKLTSRPIAYLPNAVEFESFVSAPDAMPDEYKKIPSPRVVCLGGLANPLLFDQDLIVRAAGALPKASFVLLGRIYADVSRLRGLPNVHLLGQRNYEDIPLYLKNADAGIIPYKQCRYSERVGGDMLKLFEYMACGLPVVSLKFKEFERFPSPAALAENYEEFVKMLSRALGEKDRRQYVEFARANSWERRFGELLDIIGVERRPETRVSKESEITQGPSSPSFYAVKSSGPEVIPSASGRPKIAVIHPRLQLGGGSEACVLWILEALKREYDVTLITSNEVDFIDFNTFYHTRIKPDEVKTIRVRPPRLFESGKRFAALRGYRLNLYCRENSRSYDLMFSAYNPMDFDTQGIQYLLDPLFNSQMLKMLNPTPRKLMRWFYRDSFYRRAYLRLGERLSSYSRKGVIQNITLADSNWMGEMTKAALGLETSTLYPPVSDEFSDVPWRQREDGFLCVGRIVPEKQIERVVQVLKAVRAGHPDIHLHIMGRVGDQAYAKSLKRSCRKDADWIFFEEDASAERKNKMLSSHKYGIHGKENEPFGITIAEKVKAGCIVWVPRGGGQVEIVNHPDLTYENIEDGVAKILGVIRNEAREAELRAHLRTQADKFSVKRYQLEVREIVARFLKDNDGIQA